MAKINLLTMHYDDNNGAFLQTYATCEILRNLGHQVVIINLMNPHWFWGRFKTLYNFKLIFRYIYFEICRLIYFPKRTKRMFNIDVKHLPKADYTIVGSDQVWNKSVTGYQYLSYFLNFLPTNAKRLSLSSSFGKAFVDASGEEHTQIQQLLSLFSRISVREKSGVEIIQHDFHLDAITLPDPTLALGNFDRLLPKHFHEKNYIGLFTFKPKGYSISVAKIFSKKLNKQLIWVNSYAFSRSNDEYKVGHSEIQSPREWLAYIKHADFFIADSFHGIVFCLIFHTPFIALCADEVKFERITSLLETVNLSNRIVKSTDELEEKFANLILPIEWDNVDNILQIERDRYMNYINNIIV